MLMNKKLVLSVIITIMITLGAIMIIPDTWLQQSADGKEYLPSNFSNTPITISGDDIYIVWWTNMTGNDEVMFTVETTMLADGSATPILNT
jgi:hypothetical protein